MKTQLKTMAAMLLAAVLAFGSGCTKDPENGGNNNGNENGGGNGGGNSGGGAEKGMYLGIIGFNDALATKTISLLNTSTESAFTNFIRGLAMRDGTALYHADNTALDWLQSATLPPDLINVSLVTFTDGLDNGSLILNNNYSSQAEFLNAVNNRILNDRVGGKSIDAYAIGMKGNDVQDYASFQQNLRKLSSNPSHNVFEVEDWDEVKQRFREIATQLYNETSSVSTNVKIPGGKDNGTIIRITFDDVLDGNNSTQYIMGTYTYENGKGKLSNINYYGLQSSSGTTVVSERQDGIFFWYTFADLMTPDGNAINNTDHMNLWYYNSNTTSWQHETEFTPSSYSNVSVERKSAVTVLVLDCTTSLGDDFEKMKEAATEFITTLNSNSTGGGNGGGGNGGGGGSTPSYNVSVSANPTDGGMVTGGDTYNQGTSCTVTATPVSNYNFTNWTENNEVVSNDATYTFTVNTDRTLVANFTAQPQAPQGAINGQFTINSSDQVYFAKGNLQYQGSTQKWQFAANQYDVIGSGNSNISSSYTGWIDLFGWGTSGWNCGNTYYRPWDSNNSNESLYGPPGNYNLMGSYANSDWGYYNAISNGGNQTHQWRTLTQSEWDYVFNQRNTTSGKRYAKAQVNGVNGVILLPDDWNTSYYSLSSYNSSGASYTSNVISSSNWTNYLEAHGAVFLPAAGFRNGTTVGDVGSFGNYWSASYYSSNKACYVLFSNGGLSTDYDYRYYGHSVRLVCPAE